MSAAVPTLTVRSALTQTMEAHAIGQVEAQEVRELGAHLLALLDYGVPVEKLREIFEDLREIARLNDAQNGQLMTVAGDLDELVAVLHRTATHGNPGRALGIKSLARALRPALHTIAFPERFAAREYVSAVRVVDRVLAATPASRLLSTTLRHELGDANHVLLISLMDANA